MDKNIELSVVMPCLNEAKTVGNCINKAFKYISDHNIVGEVIIADNGSNDGSKEIANQHGAKVVTIDKKGYGSALIGGIKSAKGKYIIMGDADDSYDFSALSPYVEKLREGYDLVMGNRFKGGIEEGAMPFLHKYLGNPVLSFVGRLFFNNGIGDFHCGLRGFRKDSFLLMNPRSSGMEFASELVVKASLLKMKIIEVPTKLSPDGRDRPPHLNTWRDGWRHLRFLLMFSPRWLFLYPGITMIIIGLLFSAILITQPLNLGSVVLDVHSLLYFSGFIVIGFQLLFFFAFTKTYAIESNILPTSNRYKNIYKYFNLERGLSVGLFLFIIGIIITIRIILEWASVNFGELIPTSIFREVIPAVTLLILGVQFILHSFFLSILGYKMQSKLEHDNKD